MKDRQFARLLEFLSYPWRGYRKVRQGAKKRVARHMAEYGCCSLEAYLERIAGNPGVMAEYERRIAVTRRLSHRSRG